jgi:hypothetical protein
MDAIADKLIALAKEGDVQAIKLLFSYTLGQPAEAVEPDQLDADEWNRFKQTANMAGELPGLMATPDPSFPLTLVRAARPGVARDLAKQLHTTLKEGEERERKRQERWERHHQRRQQRKEQRLARQAGIKSGKPSGGKRTTSLQAPVPSPQDLEAHSHLEALAAQDNQALKPLTDGGNDCHSLAKPGPLPNGVNGAAPAVSPAESAPSTNRDHV